MKPLLDSKGHFLLSVSMGPTLSFSLSLSLSLSLLHFPLKSGYGDGSFVPEASIDNVEDCVIECDGDDPWKKSEQERVLFDDIFPSETADNKRSNAYQVIIEIFRL